MGFNLLLLPKAEAETRVTVSREWPPPGLAAQAPDNETWQIILIFFTLPTIGKTSQMNSVFLYSTGIAS